MLIWNDKRSGKLGCEVGNQVLEALSEVHGRIRRSKGTVFASDSRQWIARFSQEVYLTPPICHWANLSWDQHIQFEGLARERERDLFYLFITLAASSDVIDYWEVPADLVEEFIRDRFGDQSDRSITIHIKNIAERYLIDSLDVTSFHRTLEKRKSSDIVGGDALSTENKTIRRRKSRRRNSALREADGNYQEYLVPLSCGRTALLNVPPNLDPADVTRIKGWVDLMSDVLTAVPGNEERKPSNPQGVIQAWIDNEVVGTWKNRRDISDSSEFARKLRKKAQRRSRS